MTQTKTCVNCPYFENYHEDNGRGWCHCFDHQARTQHVQTNDCDRAIEALKEQEANTTQAQSQAITPNSPVLAYQKQQLLKQLKQLDGALSSTYTVHQQRLGKLQRQFNEDRQALTRQIVALREAIQQLGGIE